MCVFDFWVCLNLCNFLDKKTDLTDWATRLSRIATSPVLDVSESKSLQPRLKKVSKKLLVKFG